MSEANEEQPREGRKTNIIVTYEELSGINKGVQRIDSKVDHLAEEIKRIGTEHADHEIRLRALELNAARNDGGRGFAQWASTIVISLVMGLFALLNYLKP